jgi:biotin-dependent carboxylase-like uncharacterized protein
MLIRIQISEMLFIIYLDELRCKLIEWIQDCGRYNYQKFGMPAAGAMDLYSLKVANILVGNNEEEACFEITLIGPELKFEGSTVISITGGNMSPMINGQMVDMWVPVKISDGDVLSFGPVKSGCRSYIAGAGGIDVPVLMGSKSTYVRGKIGGFEGRTLKVRDEIKTGEYKNEFPYNPVKLPDCFTPVYKSNINVRVVMGPQDDYFTQDGIDTFLNSEYKVTNKADRMGYRLSGSKIAHKNGADIISDGIMIGSIQVPGDGAPIIMMVDRQTTGGYTKIATVITLDINYISQLKPGDSVTFQSITIEEAQKIYKEYMDSFSQIKSYIQKNIQQK